MFSGVSVEFQSSVYLRARIDLNGLVEKDLRLPPSSQRSPGIEKPLFHLLEFSETIILSAQPRRYKKM